MLSRTLLQRLSAVLAHGGHREAFIEGAAAAVSAAGVPAVAAITAAAQQLNAVWLGTSHPGWANASCRSVATSAAVSQAARDDDVPQQGESYYWIPPAEQQSFTFNRRTIADRRATGRLESALDAVLTSNGVLREQLVDRYGFCIHRVHLSKDRRTVFILWDATSGKAQACQHVLEKTAFRLRQDLAKVMRSKHTPYIEFRHDHLPPMQAAAAAAMEAAEQELAATEAAAAAAAARRAAGQSSAAAAAAGLAGQSSNGSTSSSVSSSLRSAAADAGSSAKEWDAAVDAATDADESDSEECGSEDSDVNAAIRRLQVITRKTRPE